MTNKKTIVSTPGKVLVTGGYLVLERKAGLVLSLDSRFHVTITDAQDSDHQFRISSPQFTNGQWILDESGELMYFVISQFKFRISKYLHTSIHQIFSMLN